MNLGTPEIVVDGYRVRAVYPTTIIRTAHETVVLQPEIKEEGKPYQAAKTEFKTTVRDEGTLYVECPNTRDEQFFFNDKHSNSFWRKREEWKATATVYIAQKVITTRD
jgi:hypothetical protein